MASSTNSATIAESTFNAVELLTPVSSTQTEVFISHNGDHKSLCVQLWLLLEAFNVASFLDAASLRPGEKFPEEISNALNECRIGVLVLTRNFFHSKWCRWEALTLLERTRNEKEKKAKVLPIFYGKGWKEAAGKDFYEIFGNMLLFSLLICTSI